MAYDLITWQDDDGMNIAVARTKAGLDWMAKSMPTGELPGDFFTFVESIPQNIRVGILDPTRKILNFTSRLLH